MADEIPDETSEEASQAIELIADDDGLAVIGAPGAVERFLDSLGLLSASSDLPLRRVLEVGSEVAHAASDVVENSGRYVKLTRESAERVRQFGLTPTNTPGISHAMIGKRGSIEKWIQIESGPASLLSSPMLLSGVGGLLAQIAKQAEAEELKALLVKMDEKLDDVRRDQRDSKLAKLDRARLEITQAIAVREYGGNQETAWGKVKDESGTLSEVQSSALRALGALADKVEGKGKVGELAKATREIEREASIWLAVLAHCFELQDEFAVLEIDHVLGVAPQEVDGHLRALAETRQQRRDEVVAVTQRLMDRMVRAGAFADGNVLLHFHAARSVVGSVNSTAVMVNGFHAPLGIGTEQGPVVATRWRDALRDPGQLKNAGAEAAEKTAVGLAVAGAAVVVVRKAAKAVNKIRI